MLTHIGQRKVDNIQKCVVDKGIVVCFTKKVPPLRKFVEKVQSIFTTSLGNVRGEASRIEVTVSVCVCMCGGYSDVR